MFRVHALLVNSITMLLVCRYPSSIGTGTTFQEPEKRLDMVVQADEQTENRQIQLAPSQNAFILWPLHTAQIQNIV